MSEGETVELYEPEKRIWTQADFDQMGWHDVYIHGMILEEPTIEEKTRDLVLDIDYMFQWVDPVPPAKCYTAWIAPCTLAFENAFDVAFEFKQDFGLQFPPWQIMELEMEGNSGPLGHGGAPVYEWFINLLTGYIRLKSSGYTQIVRQRPIHVPRQDLTQEERGGIGFGRKPY